MEANLETSGRHLRCHNDFWKVIKGSYGRKTSKNVLQVEIVNSGKI